MDRFEHTMRTTQHVKSVEMIMTRTNNHFLKSKIINKKHSPQAENITTYMRKVFSLIYLNRSKSIVKI